MAVGAKQSKMVHIGITSTTLGIYVIMSLLTVAHSLNIASTCPCEINERNGSVDCSGKNITVIPDCVLSRQGVKHLDLSMNAISSLPPGTFTNFSELLRLNVSRNRLTRISNGTFNGLYNLKVLSLSHNTLSRNYSFNADMFVPLTKLQSLHIQGNLADYPDRALSKASSVKFLAIDGLPGRKFGPGFSGMKSLTTLRMDDNDGYCDMDNILPETFANLRETPLEHIEFLQCSMHSIPPYTFSCLTHLTSIKATWSRTMCDGMLENFTMGLNTTNIKRLQLTQMCHIMSFRLGENAFSGLTNTSLEYLDLESNKIEYVNKHAINKLPQSLRYFSLKDNFLDDIRFLKEMVILSNLEVFDMSYQSYYNIGRHLQRPQSLQILQNNTSLRVVSKPKRYLFFARTDKSVVKYSASKPKKTINTHDPLMSNKATLLNNSEKSIDDKIYLPPRLRVLYSSHLRLDSYAIIPLTFAQNSLQYLDLSVCQLQGFLGPWNGLHNLEFFNLTYNRFKSMHPKSFSDMINLKTLLLQYNEIGDEIMQLDQKGELFANLTKLLTLDLSRNNIRELPPLIFRNQRKLVNLSLSWNSLSGLTFTLDTLINLKLLNVSYNHLSSISNKAAEQLDKIASVSNLEIDLRGNPLICDCERLSFVNWLVRTKVRLTEGQNLTCLYRNGSKVSIQNIDYIRNQLQIECVSWIILIVSASGLFSLLVVISFFALYHHKRWQLRYLINRNKGALIPYHSLLGEELTFNNDVYISYEPDFLLYNGTDLDEFVKRRLFPFLEGKGFKVLFQDNLQSEAGKNMGTIITKTIRRTRKVVALLTSSYFLLGDTWKAWEFNMAVYEGIYTKRTVIVPVVIGELTPDYFKRQPEIRSYVESMTTEVLKFPRLDEEMDEFLAHLCTRCSQ